MGRYGYSISKQTIAMDYVFPYVDGSDPVWREQYRRANNSISMDESRFRPFGTLRYVFRGIAENMPFIDRVVLIVSTESQVPDWINREKVRIVTHEEFMPAEHLPTFSSSAIESDMWRIECLSERFIYGNDDCFPLKPLTEADFFDGNKPRLTFSASDYRIQNVFRKCCRKGMDMIADAVGCPRTDPDVLLKPQHCMKGVTVDHMKRVGELCGAQIDRTVTPHRHQRNVTGYIYDYFAFYTDDDAPFEKDFKYIRITDDYSEILDLLKDPDVSILCINDAGQLSAEHYEEASRALQNSLDRLFPERCSYEIS